MRTMPQPLPQAAESASRALVYRDWQICWSLLGARLMTELAVAAAAGRTMLLTRTRKKIDVAS
jgi:hypothetical protein